VVLPYAWLLAGWRSMSACLCAAPRWCGIRPRLLFSAVLAPVLMLTQHGIFPVSAAALHYCCAGSWGLQQSLELEWTEGHNWRAEVQMPGGAASGG
jgi:hypothetical protein